MKRGGLVEDQPSAVVAADTLVVKRHRQIGVQVAERVAAIVLPIDAGAVLSRLDIISDALVQAEGVAGRR